MARKHDVARFHRFYRIVTRQRVCVYCGVPATTIDHFVPLSVVALIRSALDQIEGRVLLPSCGECNGMAGNGVFVSVAMKRRFIQAKIAKKYRHVLSMPEWREDELEGLGYSLQTFISSGREQKQWVKERLGWRNTHNSDAVTIAKIRSNLRVRGNDSVRPHANSAPLT